jgi:hypothetical protein
MLPILSRAGGGIASIQSQNIVAPSLTNSSNLLLPRLQSSSTLVDNNTINTKLNLISTSINSIDNKASSIQQGISDIEVGGDILTALTDSVAGIVSGIVGSVRDLFSSEKTVRDGGNKDYQFEQDPENGQAYRPGTATPGVGRTPDQILRQNRVTVEEPDATPDNDPMAIPANYLNLSPLARMGTEGAFARNPMQSAGGGTGGRGGNNTLTAGPAAPVVPAIGGLIGAIVGAITGNNSRETAEAAPPASTWQRMLEGLGLRERWTPPPPHIPVARPPAAAPPAPPAVPAPEDMGPLPVTPPAPRALPEAEDIPRPAPPPAAPMPVPQAPPVATPAPQTSALPQTRPEALPRSEAAVGQAVAPRPIPPPAPAGLIPSITPAPLEPINPRREIPYTPNALPGPRATGSNNRTGGPAFAIPPGSPSSPVMRQPAYPAKQF